MNEAYEIKRKDNKKPRMTDEQILFAEELYKAHYSPKEAAKLLSFGYGCLAGYWQRFKFAKVKKYDRLELLTLGGDNANDQIDRVSR